MSTDPYKSPAYLEWLAERPPWVQELARKIKPASVVLLKGERLIVIGYDEWEGERVGLILSPVDPCEDYDGAIAAQVKLCPDETDLLFQAGLDSPDVLEQ